MFNKTFPKVPPKKCLCSWGHKRLLNRSKQMCDVWCKCANVQNVKLIVHQEIMGQIMSPDRKSRARMGRGIMLVVQSQPQGNKGDGGGVAGPAEGRSHRQDSGGNQGCLRMKEGQVLRDGCWVSGSWLEAYHLPSRDWMLRIHAVSHMPKDLAQGKLLALAEEERQELG